MHTPIFTPLAVAEALPASASRTSPASSAENRVEIVLVNGRRLVVPVDMDPEALARLLPVVDRA